MVFSQKYCLVQFLTPLEDDTEFDSSEWPLHSTIAGVFAIDWTSDRRAAFRQLLSDTPKTNASTLHDDYFGPDRDVHVMLVERTNELMKMHLRVINFIQQEGGRFNEPSYLNDAFRPHITITHEALTPQQKIHFHALTLIDMFPQRNHQRRRVMETIMLKESTVQDT